MIETLPAPEIQRLSIERIFDVLGYVIPSEIRILEAEGSANQLLAVVQFRSAQYTRYPVDYLSLAELVIVLAQAGQLLVDLHIEGNTPELSMALARARNEHRVYFGRFAVRFHKKHPAEDYSVQLYLRHLTESRGTWYGQLEFTISDFVSGAFLGIVESLGQRR